MTLTLTLTLRRARRCASETAEPTQTNGADAKSAAKACAEDVAVGPR